MNINWKFNNLNNTKFIKNINIKDNNKDINNSKKYKNFSNNNLLFNILGDNILNILNITTFPRLQYTFNTINKSIYNYIPSYESIKKDESICNNNLFLNLYNNQEILNNIINLNFKNSINSTNLTNSIDSPNLNNLKYIEFNVNLNDSPEGDRSRAEIEIFKNTIKACKENDTRFNINDLNNLKIDLAFKINDYQVDQIYIDEKNQKGIVISQLMFHTEKSDKPFLQIYGYTTEKINKVNFSIENPGILLKLEKKINIKSTESIYKTIQSPVPKKFFSENIICIDYEFKINKDDNDKYFQVLLNYKYPKINSFIINYKKNDIDLDSKFYFKFGNYLNIDGFKYQNSENFGNISFYKMNILKKN